MTWRKTANRAPPVRCHARPDRLPSWDPELVLIDEADTLSGEDFLKTRERVETYLKENPDVKVIYMTGEMKK